MMIKNYNQKKKKQDFRSPIMTERFLTTVLKVSSCPKMTKKAVLLNMQSFMNQIDPATFEKDPNVFSLMLAIKIVLKNRLEGVDDPSDLVEYVNLEIMDNYEEQKSNIIFPTILSSTDTSDKEKNLVLNTIDNYVNYQNVLEKKDDLADILSDLGSGNISNLDNSISSLRSIINSLYDEFQKTNTSKEAYTFIHTSENQEFRERLEDAHAYAISDKVCLHTGLKRFNEMLSTKGGFLGGKFYMFYADRKSVV